MSESLYARLMKRWGYELVLGVDSEDAQAALSPSLSSIG
jgi:hypothetical protein